jgi:hypothetical protein
VGLFRAADRLDNWALPKIEDAIDHWPSVALFGFAVVMGIALYIWAIGWDWSAKGAALVVAAWLVVVGGILMSEWARKRRSADDEG